MAFPLPSILCVLTALLVVPYANANDILSTYPSFAKCDQNVINIIKMKNSISILPSTSFYQKLEAKETWVKVRSSYNFKMSPENCVTMVVKDNWFNVTVDGPTSSYNLSYVVKDVDEGLEGHTVPDEPRRSWRMIPVLAGDDVLYNYVCNVDYESNDTPLHGDIIVAKSAMNNLLGSTLIKRSIEMLARTVGTFTQFTFFSKDKCYN